MVTMLIMSKTFDDDDDDVGFWLLLHSVLIFELGYVH